MCMHQLTVKHVCSVHLLVYQQFTSLTTLPQINRMVKHMNKGKPSEERIKVTTTALNHSMPVQRSIKKLRLKHTQEGRKYVSGTMEDVHKLRSHISKVLGSTDDIAPNRVEFNKSTWAVADSADFLMLEPVSDTVETAFGNVCDWVLRNTKMLVSSDQEQWEEVDVDDIVVNDAPPQLGVVPPFRSTQ